MFTDEKTPNLLFNGIPFKKIPVVSVAVKKNNTKFHVADSDSTSLYFQDSLLFFTILKLKINAYLGKTLICRTNGAEGFKKCRKGTNVAAQTTAMTVGHVCIYYITLVINFFTFLL